MDHQESIDVWGKSTAQKRTERGKNRIIYNRGKRYSTGNKRIFEIAYSYALRNLRSDITTKQEQVAMKKEAENSNKSFWILKST